MAGVDRRWGAVLATPVLAFVVGTIALPRPQGVVAEQTTFDRKAVADVVKTTAPPVRVPVGAVFGGAIELRGYDGPQTALSRGARLSSTLLFSAVGDVDSDWQVFVHIDAAESAGFRINADHWPAAGRYRTGLWQQGEYVVDRFEQTIPMNAPAGVYDMWVGLYRGDTRLPVTTPGGRVDTENRVRVGQIVVE